MAEEWEDTLAALSSEGNPLYTPSGRLRKTKTLSRADIIRAFQTAFELIGDIPRLAVWADANPSDFYKLYGRLLPSSNSSELDAPQEIIIRHALLPPNYDPNAIQNAQQGHNSLVHAEGDFRELPPTASTVVDRGGPPAGRENSSDDK